MLTPKCIIPSLLHPPYQLNCHIHSHDCIIAIPLVQQISFSSSIAIFSLYINEVSYNTSPEISQLKCAIKKGNPVKRKQSTFLKIKYDNLMAFDKYCYHTSKKTLYNIYHMAYLGSCLQYHPSGISILVFHRTPKIYLALRALGIHKSYSGYNYFIHTLIIQLHI